MSSADALLKTFLNMSVKEILRCPTLVYVRVVYASVILIKLSISTSMPTSELGKIISHDSNKIDMFLEQLLPHFKAAATLEQGGKHVLSSVFLRILTKLKLWFEHQKTQPTGLTNSTSTTNENNRSGVLDEDPWEAPATEQTELTEATEPSLNYDQDTPYSFADPPQQTQPTTTYQSQIQANDTLGLFPDFNSQSTGYLGLPNHLYPTPPQQKSPRLMQPQTQQSWPTTTPFQPNMTSYSEPLNPNFADFPMDQDPNLWTHLANAELDQNGQDNLMYDVDSYTNFDYTTMPELNWGTWPQQ